MISRFQWSPRTSALRAMVHGQPDVSVRFTSCRVHGGLHHVTQSSTVGCIMEPKAAVPTVERHAHGDVGTETVIANEWKPTACILCECNCGIEIRLGADGRTFERTRGDKSHPASKGYTCEKALRLDYYQNGRGERLLSPLRRRPDGTFEEIDWDTAIREVAQRLAAVRDTYGGES